MYNVHVRVGVSVQANKRMAHKRLAGVRRQLHTLQIDSDQTEKNAFFSLSPLLSFSLLYLEIFNAVCIIKIHDEQI